MSDPPADHPVREPDARRTPRAARERRAWIAVVAWTLLIFATIPLARAIQTFVRGHFGKATFGWVVLAVVLASTGAAVAWLVRRRHARPAFGRRVAWLAAVAGVFAAYTVVLWENPEEALHFVQYGVLGVLLHRALAYRLHDAGIYVVATALGAAAGIVDEAIQWLTPRRLWALRDVWLNTFSVALAQVAIALGIRPAGIRGRPGPRSVRWLCRSTALAVLLLGASLLNTPERIRAYTERVPALSFLRTTEGVMLEYGHLHHDPEIGRFRSRFTLEELRRIDAARAAEAAEILDRHPGDAGYETFLERYTPITDPFLHELRVHLFRRDRYLERASGNPREPRIPLDVAYREQRILEEYFGETFRRSRQQLAPELRERLAAAYRPDVPYDSAVSRDLVTRVGEGTIATILLVVLLALAAADRRFGGRTEPARWRADPA
jgi:VanZ family protein